MYVSKMHFLTSLNKETYFKKYLEIEGKATPSKKMMKLEEEIK